jgi:hypothetical protein
MLKIYYIFDFKFNRLYWIQYKVSYGEVVFINVM